MDTGKHGLSLTMGINPVLEPFDAVSPWAKGPSGGPGKPKSMVGR
jgi:hypothetical protein